MNEIDILEDEFDNGYGMFSRWDSFRGDTGMDKIGFIFRNGQWMFTQNCINGKHEDDKIQ